MQERDIFSESASLLMSVTDEKDKKMIGNKLESLLLCLNKQVDKNTIQTKNDRKKVNERMGGFDQSTSRAYAELQRRKWDKKSQPELLSILLILANKQNLQVDREVKRRKEVMFKWFDENFDTVYPFFDCISFEN